MFTPSDSPRILIARMSAVGDTILTLPVASAVRERFPNAFLGWIVEQGASPVVQGHTCLDEVFVVPRGWFVSPSGVLAVRRQLQPYEFQFAIDCQSMTKSSLACWLSGAPTRIGCLGEHGRELSSWMNNVLVEPQHPHVVDRSLELLLPLGIEQPRVQWKFPLDRAAQRRAEAMIAALGLADGFAVINPGANCPSRRWEMDRFGQLAARLGRQHQLPSLVIWGTDQERQWAQEIVHQSAGQARLAPATTLPGLAALIEKGRLLVSADTGPLHLAVAVGTPSVSLHGVTRPEQSGPHGAPHIAIQMRCDQLSHRQRKKADNRAMRLITTRIVYDACRELLATTPGRTAPAAA